MARSRLLQTSALVLAAGILMITQAGCQKAGASQAPINASDPNAGPMGGQSDPGPLVAANSGGGQARYAVPYPPPALPTYDQPPPPQEGDMWTPGYWAWDDQQADYYWTPGTWVMPPRPDVYWTPGYWRDQGDGYGFIPGYWGAIVGFYGGINYGWGYGGDGYDGGRWQNNRFYYNSYANNLGNGGFNNVYGQGQRNRSFGGVSFNGGRGGVQARPTSQQATFARGAHVAPTQAQVRHFQMARGQPGLLASANHGRPPIAATARPGRFQGAGVVTQAQATQPYNPPAQAVRPSAFGGPGQVRQGQGGGVSRGGSAQFQTQAPARPPPGAQNGRFGAVGQAQRGPQANPMASARAVQQQQQQQAVRIAPNRQAPAQVQQRAQYQAPQAQRAQPQRAQPQMAQPQRAAPQMAQPQRAQPQRAAPQMAQPQRAPPQRAPPQVAQPRRAPPQRGQPQNPQDQKPHG